MINTSVKNKSNSKQHIGLIEENGIPKQIWKTEGEVEDLWYVLVKDGKTKIKVVKSLTFGKYKA